LFKSPLLHKLTGESTVYPQLPGIAKIIVDNERLVRSYGTFPHPNILGGFLIVSILISVYLLLKHKDYILSSIGTKFNLFYNINNTKGQGCVSSIFWIILIFTQITALLFTFSRTAWFSFLLSLFIISVFYFYNRKIVSRETIRSDKIAKRKLFFFLSSQNFFWNDSGRKNIWDPVRITFTKIARKILFIDTFWISPEFISGGMTKDIKTTKIGEALSKLKSKLKSNKNVSRETFITKSGIDYYYLFCRFKELFIVILLTLILIAVYSSHINSRINEELSINNSSFSNYLPSNYAFNDRSFYNNVSRETISGNFIFGSGPGTFIFQINSYLTKNNIHQKLESWQYQPAHNIYLLIASEIGIIGLFIFLLFLSQTISNSFKTIKKPLNKRLFSNDVQIVSRETIFSLELNYYLLAILISFLFIGLFDHYFWTLQQGRLMLWLVLGLILINDSIMLKKDK
jgi:O-antigen ligase